MDVLKEVPRVREDLGYPPLVTPSSQIVGTQAVLNVLTGGRYKMVSKETKGVLYAVNTARRRFDFGRNCIKKIIGDEPRITCRPADKIKPSFEAS